MKRILIVLMFSAIISLSFGVFATWYLYQVSNSIDYEQIHITLTTNQTHVDLLTCSDLKLAINGGKGMIFNPPPEYIYEDLRNVAVDKKCSFIVPPIK